VSVATEAAPLKRTPLYDLHCALGARMVGFAGYEMPVQYPAGIIAEHLHTRAKAGLFDVSHMGQIGLHGAAAARALEALVPGDLQGLLPRRMRYTLLLNEPGGILDDLIATRTDDGLMLVVNAGCKEADSRISRPISIGRSRWSRASSAPSWHCKGRKPQPSWRVLPAGSAGWRS